MAQAQAFERLRRQVLVIEHPLGIAIEVTGADALDWLEGMLTADVRDKSRRVSRSLCLDRWGKIQSEVLFWGDAPNMRLVVVGGERQHLLEHLQRYIIMEDVELRIVDDRLYSFHGPKVAAIAEQLTGLEGVSIHGLSWLTRTDVVGLVPPRQDAELRRRIERSGSKIESAGVWQQLRVEHGLATYGSDYDASDTPGTAGLVEELVSLTKGCYLGQEVVCKLLMRGTVREQSVRLEFDAPPTVGAEIRLAASGEPIGRITSVGPASDHGAWAIGRVKMSAVVARANVVSQAILGQICPRATG